MQPWSLDLYSYSFVDHPGRDAGIRRSSAIFRIEAPWQKSELETVAQDLRTVHRRARLELHDRKRHVLRALLGPSGCGKTTTLRMIAGLELPTVGAHSARRRGRHLPARAARDIAFVFQLFALYPHMNVRQNIGFPLQCQDYAARRDQASGSRRPRGCCASSICSTRKRRRSVRRRPPARRAGPRHRAPAQGLPDGRAAGRARCRVPQADVRRAARTARPDRRDHVYVTHDQLEAMAMADRIAVMNAGPRRADRHAAGDLRSSGSTCSWPTSSARRR